MGFSVDVSVSAVTVFLQGLLSFFSPCVLPLLPLYIGYLSGGTGKQREDGRIHYERRKVMIHTLCFVVGVSSAFFLLGFGFSALGGLLKSGKQLFSIAGGILIILFGLYQLGLFGNLSVMGKERRLPFKVDVLAMSPVTALIMGFTFSFAWTPCVGPALTSVLLMAASTESRTAAFFLIGVYTLGFVLPFLAVGLFTTAVLEFFKAHRGVVKYTVKAGGLLMIVMGLLMVTGRMNDVSGYLSSLSGEGGSVRQESQETGGAAETDVLEKEAETGEREKASEASEEPRESSAEAAKEPAVIPAVDFTLQDQFGNTHSLSDYEGKTIFLNFWATWCPPCKAEMPDIQKLYENAETEGENALVVLGVATPGLGGEQSQEGVAAFLEEKGYTYPVLMDTTGELTMAYGISSYPTTFMIDRDGNVFGYISGQLSLEMMEDIVAQTLEGKRREE